MPRTQLAAGGLSAASAPMFFTAAQAYSPAYGDSHRSSATAVQPSNVFDISPDLLALASFESRRWLRVNPAFKTLLGWEEDELVGRPLLEIVHSADRSRIETVESDVRASGVANLEIRLRCKSGGCRWIAWHIAPDEHGDALLFVGRDVTRNRRTIRNLRTASVRMQRENENLEQFVRTAGHDLQEPLRTLSMYSELLKRSYGPQMPGQSVELLSQIFGAATRMQTLVRDLLLYASIVREQQTDDHKFRDVSLSLVFEEVLETLTSSVQDASATITHDPLPEVRGDQTQLTQLLQNLLSNSLKYRRPEVPVRIHIGVEKICGEWQFTITDNGLGFDPKYGEGIFLDFKRLHGREIPGTGLGLAICRRIVERHGGRIWAQGRPGEGATFWFTLPTRAHIA